MIFLEAFECNLIKNRHKILFWSGLSYFDKLLEKLKISVFHKIMCKIGYLWHKFECNDLPTTAQMIYVIVRNIIWTIMSPSPYWDWPLCSVFRLRLSICSILDNTICICPLSSPGNDKFKVVFFDNEGHVTMVEESQQRKRKSEANLYVVPFGRYNLSETMPLSMMKRLDEEVPPVFMILDTFDKDVKSLLPGTHLFCVYGDNWFQSVKYQLRCLVAVPTSSDCVVDIQENEKKLAEKKRHLENFQSEFCDVKKKYEEACKKLEEDITETIELIQHRDTAYSEYIEKSGVKYSHVAPTKQQLNQSGGAGLLGGIGKLFG